MRKDSMTWGYMVGLMSLLMIHKAYMPVYIALYTNILYNGTRFSLRVDGASEEVQEVLANSVITDGNVPLIVYLHI